MTFPFEIFTVTACNDYITTFVNSDADSRWGDAVNESVHILILSSGSMWHSKTRKIFRNNGDVVYLDWSQGYRFSLETARSFIEVGSQMACTSMSPGHAFPIQLQGTLLYLVNGWLQV